MASKKKYYDIEAEFSAPESSNEDGFSFLDWLNYAAQNRLEAAKKREQQLKVIEEFIKKAPKIAPIKKGEDGPQIIENPADEEVKSYEAEEIVSETLARIYEEQGFFSKALQVYQKLGLIYPEKSDYFAALIKSVRKKESELKK